MHMIVVFLCSGPEHICDGSKTKLPVGLWCQLRLQCVIPVVSQEAASACSLSLRSASALLQFQRKETLSVFWEHSAIFLLLCRVVYSRPPGLARQPWGETVPLWTRL